MELGSTKSDTDSTNSSTEEQIKVTNCKVHSDSHSGFEKLRKNADKVLVGCARLGSISGLCVCGERTRQVGCTTENEGHHPSHNYGILTAIVLEPGSISRVSEVLLMATELSKCKDFADFVDNVEFRYRIVEDCKVLYRLRERTQLVLPNNRHFRLFLLEELQDSTFTGNLSVRKTLTALLLRVWWPGMVQTVTRFVKACPVCQRVKNSI